MNWCRYILVHSGNSRSLDKVCPSLRKQPTSQHEQKQISCIMTLYCGLGFLPEFCMTREANLKINSSIHPRKAVAWFSLERRLTTPKGMGNGETERLNQTLLSMLRTLPEQKTSNRKDSLNKVVHAYNCTHHEATGFSPYFLLFGRPPRLAIDLIFGTKPASCSNYPAYVKEWQTAMKEAYELAAKRSQLSGMKGKKHYASSAG